MGGKKHKEGAEGFGVEAWVSQRRISTLVSFFSEIGQRLSGSGQEGGDGSPTSQQGRRRGGHLAQRGSRSTSYTQDPGKNRDQARSSPRASDPRLQNELCSAEEYFIRCK